MADLKRSLAMAGMALAIAAAFACISDRDDDEGCSSNADCAQGQVCSASQCVQCADNANCPGGFCCQGACIPESETETRCGCGPAPADSGGANCTSSAELQLCLVNGAVATADTVADGECGCACTPAQGGPICGPPEEAGGAPTCSCADNNQNCRGASVDAAGRPHRSADTCTPDDICVCFSLGTANVCDPDGEAPDCTSTGGCASLATDSASCGVPGRSCTDAATGLEDGTGTCIEGGCECNTDSDCQGADLNVDSCDIVGDAARCICDNYARDGEPAACPMELECGAQGCILDGVAFASEEELKAQLGVP